MTPNEPVAGPAGQPVVILTPAGRDQALIGRLLDAGPIAWVGCESQRQLLDMVRAECGPIIVAEEAFDRQGIEQLIELLEHEPPWSQLPIIVLVRSGRRPQGLLKQLIDRRGVRWLRRPIDAQSLLATARLAIEARQRQQEVGRLLREQRQLNKQLIRRTHQLQQLTVAVIEAEDQERQRLSQLLHDDLQQLLVGASLHAKIAQKHLPGGGPADEAWARVQQLIDEAQQKSRSLSHELFPAVLHDAALGEMLQWIADNGNALYGLDVDLRVDQYLGSLAPPISRFIYRTLRELLCNAAKHAGVEVVQLRAWRVDDQVLLTVADQGRGFDPAQVDRQAATDGIGLRAVQERIDALGGWLTIESEPGKGSRFTLSVPARTAEPVDPSPCAAEQAHAGSPSARPQVHIQPHQSERTKDEA